MAPILSLTSDRETAKIFLLLSVFIVFCLERSMSLSQGDCPNNQMDQKMSCRPGQALSSIRWAGNEGFCKEFSITCENATDRCEETCTWRQRCDSNGEKMCDYVRGIHVMYDHLWDKQKVLFLCCTVGVSPRTKCRGQMAPLGGKSASHEHTIIKQAAANNDNDASLSQSLSVEFCTLEGNNITLCPLSEMHSTIKMDPELAALAGLAGLSGLAGIALLKKKCCCNGANSVNTPCEAGCTLCSSDTICGDISLHFICDSSVPPPVCACV